MFQRTLAQLERLVPLHHYFRVPHQLREQMALWAAGFSVVPHELELTTPANRSIVTTHYVNSARNEFHALRMQHDAMLSPS